MLHATVAPRTGAAIPAKATVGTTEVLVNVGSRAPRLARNANVLGLSREPAADCLARGTGGLSVTMVAWYLTHRTQHLRHSSA